MIKKYSRAELAEIIVQIIRKEYLDSQKLYSSLKSNFDRKIKALAKRDLTESELEKHGLSAAASCLPYISAVSATDIEPKISQEIVNLGLTGFEIAEHRKYFFDSAKSRVTEVVNAHYRMVKSSSKNQAKPAKSKKKRK